MAVGTRDLAAARLWPRGASAARRANSHAGTAARRDMIRVSCLFALLLGCLIGPLISPPAGHAQSDPERAAARSSHRAEQVAFPAADPHTPAKERLGRSLLFDPLLSGSASLSCASCRNPGLSWGDGPAICREWQRQVARLARAYAARRRVVAGPRAGDGDVSGTWRAWPSPSSPTPTT